MIRTPNFKETKTRLSDLIKTQARTKSSMLQKSSIFAWVEQPNSKPTTPIVYDDFIYTDKLTKKRIKMSDAKLSYQTIRPTRKSSTTSVSNGSQNHEKKKRTSRFGKQNSQNQLEKQLIDLNECFLILKSTEMFKLNSLRQKIFRIADPTAKQSAKDTPNIYSTSEIKNGQINDMLTKKNKIRQILQDSVSQANITQFRKYFNDQNHKPNSKILSMNKHIPRSFNKTNIEKIIETLTDADKKTQDICNFIKKEEESLQFPGEQKLRADLIEYMKKLIRNNGEYLITPEKKKLLYQRLYKNVVLKSKDLSDVELNKNFTHEQICIQTNQNQNFRGNEVVSKVDIDIPTQKSILEPIVNDQAFEKKENAWSKSLSKSSSFNDKKWKNKTEYPFSGQQRKEKHKKENTCIDLSNNLKLKPKESFKISNEMASFFNNFGFSPCEKNKQISMIKSKFERNKSLKVVNLSMKEQKFLFMVENGLVFDVEKEILMKEEYLFMKDKNENNLLHICAKNHSTELFTFIIERYAKCGLKEEMRQKWGKQILKDRLFEKNKHNKNVFEVAQLYHAQEIIHYLLKLKEEMNQREYSS